MGPHGAPFRLESGPKYPSPPPPVGGPGYVYIIHPVAVLVLAWVIDRPVQAISLISSFNTGIRALPDMYALCPRGEGIHIRQIPHAHVTTIT